MTDQRLHHERVGRDPLGTSRERKLYERTSGSNRDFLLPLSDRGADGRLSMG